MTKELFRELTRLTVQTINRMGGRAAWLSILLASACNRAALQPPRRSCE
jgi:hypothetical protein